MKTFTNHKVNGVYLKLPNGNGISSIWGSGSYTDNHDWESPDGDIGKNYDTRIQEGSSDVEVMIDCDPVVLELIETKYASKSAGGGVIGHLNFDQWLDILNTLNKYPPQGDKLK